MENFKKQYRDLEMRVFGELSDRIKNSPIKSKHIEGNAIKVNVFGYTEIVIVNDAITFLDSDGYHYSIYADASLEDLIDILY
jgi:hypothetical protein